MIEMTLEETDVALEMELKEGGGGGGIGYQIGSGLKVEGGILSVDTAGKVEEDNTKPVTSAAVYTEIGNIEVLLANI